MVQAEAVGDVFETSGIADWFVPIHVGRSNIANHTHTSLTANAGNGRFQGKPLGPPSVQVLGRQHGGRRGDPGAAARNKGKR